MSKITTELIEQAQRSDLAGILSLLEENNFPTDGLSDHLSSCLVVRRDSKIEGSIAVEKYGDCGLLRSLAVHANRRGEGLGKALVAAVLASAAAEGVRDVYLLTETAALFFDSLEFVTLDRADVPEKVRQSVEFTTACPESAQAMQLHIRA